MLFEAIQVVVVCYRDKRKLMNLVRVGNSHRVIPLRQGFSTLTVLTFWMGFHGCRGYSVHCRMVSSHLGLYALVAPPSICNS